MLIFSCSKLLKGLYEKIWFYFIRNAHNTFNLRIYRGSWSERTAYGARGGYGKDFGAGGNGSTITDYCTTPYGKWHFDVRYTDGIYKSEHLQWAQQPCSGVTHYCPIKYYRFPPLAP